MKKMFFLFLLLIPTFLFSQEDSLYVDGMTWITSEFTISFTDIEKSDYLEKNEIRGDTVINGIKYKKLLTSYCYDNEWYYVDFEDCCVRYQDGKYFYYDIFGDYSEFNNIKNEYLIYDEKLSIVIHYQVQIRRSLNL